MVLLRRSGRGGCARPATCCGTASRPWASPRPGASSSRCAAARRCRPRRWTDPCTCGARGSSTTSSASIVITPAIATITPPAQLVVAALGGVPDRRRLHGRDHLLHLLRRRPRRRRACSVGPTSSVLGSIWIAVRLGVRAAAPVVAVQFWAAVVLHGAAGVAPWPSAAPDAARPAARRRAVQRRHGVGHPHPRRAPRRAASRRGPSWRRRTGSSGTSSTARRRPSSPRRTTATGVERPLRPGQRGLAPDHRARRGRRHRPDGRRHAARRGGALACARPTSRSWIPATPLLTEQRLALAGRQHPHLQQLVLPARRPGRPRVGRGRRGHRHHRADPLAGGVRPAGRAAARRVRDVARRRRSA